MASSSSSFPVKHGLQDGDLSADRKKKQKTGEFLCLLEALFASLSSPPPSFLPFLPSSSSRRLLSAHRHRSRKPQQYEARLCRPSSEGELNPFRAPGRARWEKADLDQPFATEQDRKGNPARAEDLSMEIGWEELQYDQSAQDLLKEHEKIKFDERTKLFSYKVSSSSPLLPSLLPFLSRLADFPHL